jgi:NAD(P) transhydrogenase subunit alpha
MKVGVPRETWPGERRVALVPATAAALKKAGLEVIVEQDAGAEAGFTSAAFAAAGAAIAPRRDVFTSADIVLQVRSTPPEVAALRRGQIVIGFADPLGAPDAIRALATAGVTALSMELMPRITRAQSMDALSSMATIAGYKGVLLAADHLPRMFPMLMTAAGTVTAARVFIVGAGVAGLQAIATARRLGANVFATDVRPEVKEQIESVGGKYVGIELKETAAAGGGYAKELSEEDRLKQRELLAAQCTQSDAIITTDLIGGVFAPRLISSDMVRSMKPGTVVVDLAADGGGNCELSRPGETVTLDGVTILAPLNLAATMPLHASLLFSRNLTAFLQAFTRNQSFVVDLSDDIQQGAVITHEGTVRHSRTADALQKVGT